MTIDLGDAIKYKTPPIPNDEKEILYYDIKEKKNQYWRTPHDTTTFHGVNNKFLDILSDSYLKKQMTEKERVEYISAWRQRWLDGFWFFNNGEPTYLNSLLVDHLVFNKFDKRFFNYIESQRDDFYFRQWVIENDNVDGAMFLKPRRMGASKQEITENIWWVNSGLNRNVAMQSSKLDTAVDTLMKPLIETYLSRPTWMREKIYTNNGNTPRKHLELTNPKYDADKGEVSWLGGTVKVYSTTATAIDGTENIKVTNDELSKYPKDANPREVVDVNKKTIRNAGRRGKHNLVSTSGDNEASLDSFKEWVKLAGESKYDPLTNTSISGYVKRFTSAIHSQYLPKEFLADKYGKIDVGRNTEWVENEINKKQKGTKDYYYEKRKMPLTEEDALIAANDGVLFRKLAIIARKLELQGLPLSEKPYVRGNLIEKTDNRGCVKVYFEQDDAGLWMVAVHPYFDAERDIDCRNRFRYTNQGVYFPVKNPEFAIGYDPIRYDMNTVKSNHLSRASIIVHKKFDYHNAPNSKDYCVDVKAALYVGRPERTEEAHHEFCKAMKYWGAIGGFERQVDTVLRYVESQNMTPMLAKDKDNKYGIWTTPRIIDDGVGFLKSRYAAPQEADQVDQIETYPFEDGLIDLEHFDRTNTTVSDITMSEIMLEHTLPTVEYTNATDSSDLLSAKLFQVANPKRR